MDFNNFVAGLRTMGLPNEYAVYIAYLVQAGWDSGSLPERIGTHGLHQAKRAMKFVELKRELESANGTPEQR